MAGPSTVRLAAGNYFKRSGVASGPNPRPLFHTVSRCQNRTFDEEVFDLAAGRIRLLMGVIARSH
jgi:hypothetical protein